MDQSFSRLSFAETSLRGALNRYDLNAQARTHVERALLHVQEAMLAIREQRPVRSVDDLVKDIKTAKEIILKDQRRRLLLSRKRRG